MSVVAHDAAERVGYRKARGIAVPADSNGSAGNRRGDAEEVPLRPVTAGCSATPVSHDALK